MKTDDPKQQYALTFADFLGEELSRRKMSISELARRSGVSKQLISSVIRKTLHHRTNKLVLPSIFTVDKLARALGASTAIARAAAGYAAENGAPSAEIVTSNLPRPAPSTEKEVLFNTCFKITIEAFNALSIPERKRLLKILIISYGSPEELGDKAFDITPLQSDLNKKDYEEVEPVMVRKIDL